MKPARVEHGQDPMDAARVLITCYYYHRVDQHIRNGAGWLMRRAMNFSVQKRGPGEITHLFPCVSGVVIGKLIHMNNHIGGHYANLTP